MTQLPVDAHALFSARFADSPVPEAVLGADGTFHLVNHALCELLGRNPAELVGESPKDFAHPTDAGSVDRVLDQLTTPTTHVVQADAVLSHAFGRPLPVRLYGSVAIDDDGRRAISVLVHDLRDLFNAEARLRQQQLFLSALGAQSRDVGFVADPHGTLLYVSPAVTAMLGYEPDALIGEDGWQFVHEDDLSRAQKLFGEVVALGGTKRYPIRVRTSTDGWAWVEHTATNLLHTPIGGVVCSLVDVTEQREAAELLAREQARNKAIVEASQEGVWLVGADGSTEFVNLAMAEMLGLPIDFLTTGKPLELAASRTDAMSLAIRIRDRARRGAERYEISYQHPDGGVRWFCVSSAPVSFDDGSFFGSVAMVSDVTASRQFENDLRHAILHDPLTQLPNRALLNDRLDQTALARRHDEHAALSVLFVDLDEFKMVNDSRGHAVGDQVLVEVGRRLAAAVRPTDTVARPGGDEFIVLLPDADRAAAECIAAQLLDTLRAPVDVDGHLIHVSASIGIASRPPYDADELLRYADTALFAAKAAGRAQSRSFDSELADEAEAAFTLATDLRAALARDELQMHYQPVVDMPSGEIIGYEALARWTHPTRGDVSPDRFVEMAERVGLSRELDGWALRKAAEDYAAVRTLSRARDPYVAVNISAMNLGSAEIEEQIVQATSAAGVPPRLFALEITEGALLRDVERARAVLRRLRRRGHPIVIDDFGTGYSSLSYLRNFPITTIKIDRTFIGPAVTDSDAAAIVSSVIQMANAIGATTVAEGIETAEHAALLAQLGCTTGQGWLWARATPPAQLESLPRRFPPVIPGDGRDRPGTALQTLDATHGLIRMLQLQREGASLTTIAAALNAEHFRTPQGQRWHKLSVARALADFGPLLRRA